MAPAQKTFTFACPDDLKAGLDLVTSRDGVSAAEQIRRALAAWLEAQGAIPKKTERPRGATRKRS